MIKNVIALLLILFVLPFAGCGQKDLANTPLGQSAQTVTKTISTVKGDIEVPASPQRIVTDYYLGEFLAVGVKPVIASPYALSNPFLAEYAEGIAPLSISSSETALELIVAAQPDLIVTISEADYDNFSKIAPTVLIPYDGQRSPQELFLLIGGLVGKQEEAEAYLAAFEQDAAAVRGEIREIVGERTISFAEIWPGEVYVFGSHFARGGQILFDMWGLEAPERVHSSMVEGAKQYEVISLELLPEYTGDFLFYGVLADTDSAFVEQSSVWGTLDPVRSGKAMQYEQVAFMHSDPITLSGQLAFYTDYFRQVG